MEKHEALPRYVELSEGCEDFEILGPVIQASPQAAEVGPRLLWSYMCAEDTYRNIFRRRNMDPHTAKKRARQRIEREARTLLGDDVAAELLLALDLIT